MSLTLIWTVLSSGVKRALSWLTASSVHILIAALVLALLWGWQGHRSAGKWHGAFVKQAAAESRAEKEAEAAQTAARNAAEARYKELATHADLSHEKALADARSATDRFIGSHRVSAICSPRNSAAPASSGSAGVPLAVPADPVVVASDDVQRCSGAVTYALSARAWALSLGLSGDVVPTFGK